MKKIQETIESPPAEVKEERERKRSKTPEIVVATPQAPVVEAPKPQVDTEQPSVAAEEKSEPVNSPVPLPKPKEGK